MLYSEILNNQTIQKALQDAGVDHIESPLMKDGDFANQISELTPEVVTYIRDNEILARKRILQFNHLQAENEKKYAPQIKLSKKMEFIKPFVTKIIKGNIAPIYESLEDGIIEVVAKEAATKFNFEPSETAFKSDEDYTGLSELEKLLKQSSVTFLKTEMSPDEIALRAFHDSNYPRFLK